MHFLFVKAKNDEPFSFKTFAAFCILNITQQYLRPIPGMNS